MKPFYSNQFNLVGVCSLFGLLSVIKPITSLSLLSPKKVTPSELGKKSTALDVLNNLNKNSRLATYVTDTSTTNGKRMPLAIVTGGSSGIGIPSVEVLALSGMKVVLCARNVTAAEQVVQAEMPSSLRSNIRVQELDLSNMNSIVKAVEEIIENDCNREEGCCEVDVLLNNAGVMAPPNRMSTAQGLEVQFGTNHVGHHMLTRLLLPKIRSDGRVVTVASTAHAFGQLDFDNLNYYEDESNSRKYSAWGAYGQSKLANILFAKGLDEKLKESGSKIKSVCLHPGVIGTNLWRYSSPEWTRPLLNAIVADKNVQQGAATNAFCCLAEDGVFKGGEYVVDCAIAEPSANGKDSSGELRKKLWSATESIISENGFDLPKEVC